MAKHRICQECLELTEADGRCSECGTGKHGKRPVPDVHRDVYGTKEWKRERARVLKRDKVCVRCGEDGTLIDPATGRVNELQVDHIVPLSVGGAPFDLRNLRVLCRRCNLARPKGRADG